MIALPLRPSCRRSAYEAVDLTQDLAATVARLQSRLEKAESRGWLALWKCLTSAFQIALNVVEDDDTTESVIEEAQKFTREILSADQIYYALMLVIIGGDARPARKRAHEYSRVLRGLFREGATTPKQAFDLLRSLGIKKLAQRGRQTDGAQPISGQLHRNKVVLELSEAHEALLLASPGKAVLFRFSQKEVKGSVYKLKVDGLKLCAPQSGPVSAEQTPALAKKRPPESARVVSGPALPRPAHPS